MRSAAEPQRILVRSANWVGDAIMTTPLLRSLRQALPRSRITLLAKPWVTPVFTNNRNIDAIMVYDAGGRHRGFKGLFRLAAQMRVGRFDTALLLQNAFEAALLAWLAGIPRRIGYTTDGRTLLLTDRLRTWRPLKSGHLIDYYLGLLAGMGLPAGDRLPELYLSAAERFKAQTTLQKLSGATGGQIVIGFNPGATHGTAKRWPLERFAELGRRLIQRYPSARVLVFGAADEASLGATLTHQIGDGCYNLAGRTTLREAFALIAGCRLFVTNDSGLMHAAAALEIPLVAIIGPTDPVATGPVGRHSRIVQTPGACEKSPCLLAHCPLDQRCMTTISVEQVLSVAGDLLERIL